MSREIKARSLTSGLRFTLPRVAVVSLSDTWKHRTGRVFSNDIVHLISLNPVAWRMLFPSAASGTVELPDGDERELLFFCPVPAVLWVSAVALGTVAV